MKSKDINVILSSAVLVFFGGIISSGSKLVERVVIGRFFSPEVYGEISVMLAIVYIGVTISLLGLGEGVPRQIPRFDQKDDRRGIWVSGFITAFSFSILVSGALLLTRDYILSNFINESKPDLFLLFITVIPLLVCLRLVVAGIRGHENTTYKSLVQDLIYPILRVSLLGIVLSFGFHLTAIGYSYIASIVIAVGLGLLLLNKILQLGGPINTHFTSLLRFSLPLSISTLLSLLMIQTDTVMLGFLRSSQEVGLYNAAYPFAKSLWFILGSFGFIYLPLTSRVKKNESSQSVNEVYQLTTKWILILSFPLFLVLTTFSADILATTFGKEYQRASLALVILSIGLFSNSVLGRNRGTLTALGHTRTVLWCNLFAYVGNVLINLLLIPYYGIYGAAIASAFAFTSANILANIYLKYRFDIHPFSTAYTKLFFGLLTLFIPFGILSRQVTASLFILCMLGIAAALLSLIIFLLVGTGPEDQMVIKLIETKIGYQIPIIKIFFD